MATFTTFTKTPSSDPHSIKSSQNFSHQHRVPDTAGVVEGSAKRNILRKGKTGGSGPRGKFKSDVTEDGSSVLHGPKPVLDPGDPLFDVEDDENYILSTGEVSGSPRRRSYDPEYRRMVVGPLLTLSEFKRRTISALEEYFSSEDTKELITSLIELQCPDYHYEIVKKSISLSLDRAERERELISKFLSDAYGNEFLSTDTLGKGFERLFEMIDELEIDCPGAGQCIAVFLARALVDEILPPSFLTDPVVASLGGDIVAQTKRMLSRDHQYSRLERIWGPGDGRSVPELKLAIDALLNEYLTSFDLLEAERCVRELRVPHFHHELVKRAIVLVMDKTETEHDLIGQLIKHLFNTEVVSMKQIQQGLNKIHSNLNDLSLDAPCAPKVLDYFYNFLKQENLLEEEFKI